MDYNRNDPQSVMALLLDHDKEHDERIVRLEEADRAAVLGCPFYPGREENGNDLIHRVQDLEDFRLEVRTGTKWFWRGLVGFGVTNLVLAATLLVRWVG